MRCREDTSTPGKRRSWPLPAKLAEETGVHVSVGALHQVGLRDQPGWDPRGRYVTFAYMAVVADGTQATAGDDARAARWCP
ncbi:hypothetical protein ACIPJK_37290 [Streptomyces roseus]|uniref:hypothetical protein n=1 Tax=Streptomyces roseus TaxID=66430 RepID=UPI00380A2B39